ncbi:type VI secretion system protein TssA [Bordetella avium]|nr:type VI secretion system protein TssA [Bordetella avium]
MGAAFAAHRASREWPVIEHLLQAISGEPAGRSLRYDPITTRISAMRQEDDASLPQGEWQRELQRADWNGVAALCEEALVEHGKDFQVAAWLCEAWARQRGLEGLCCGAQLLDGLIANFWEDGWPAIEDDDVEARRAPFVWLVATLPVVLLAHIPLLDNRAQAWLTVDVFRRLTMRGAAQADEAPQEGPDMAQVERLIAAQPQHGDVLRTALDQARLAWEALDRRLNEHLGLEAPSFEPLREAFRQWEACLAALWPLKAISQPEPVVEVVAPSAEPETMSVPARIERPRDRAHAYQQIEMIAAYLAEIEPHSPTPYLLRQAASWGAMPLDVLMRSIAQEEGGLARLLSLLDVA